jgi:hypothetical protein
VFRLEGAGASLLFLSATPTQINRREGSRAFEDKERRLQGEWSRPCEGHQTAARMGPSAGSSMVAHFIEVLVTDPVYFALGSYTTLGYGDIVPGGEWTGRSLGPTASSFSSVPRP